MTVRHLNRRLDRLGARLPRDRRDDGRRDEAARLAAMPTDELVEAYFERLSAHRKAKPPDRRLAATLAEADLPQISQMYFDRLKVAGR